MTAKTRHAVLSEESLFADALEPEPHQTQPIDLSADILTQRFQPEKDEEREENGEATLRLDLESLAAADARAALQTKTASTEPRLPPDALPDMVRSIVEELHAQTPPPPKMWAVAAFSGILSGVVAASLVTGIFLLHDGHPDLAPPRNLPTPAEVASAPPNPAPAPPTVATPSAPTAPPPAPSPVLLEALKPPVTAVASAPMPHSSSPRTSLRSRPNAVAPPISASPPAPSPVAKAEVESAAAPANDVAETVPESDP